LSEDSTRDRILAAAARLSQRPTTSDFTLEQLADELGLHYTAIYHYFEGKDDLALALIEAIGARRLELLEAARKLPGSALDQVCAFVAMELDEPPTDVPQRFIQLLKDPFRERANASEGKITGRIADLLERGVADGSIDTGAPKTVAVIIRSILNRYRNRGERLLMGRSPRDISEAMADVIKHGISSGGIEFEDATSLSPRPFPLVTSPDQGLDRVVGSLTAEFNRLGYEGTSIPRVAKSVGVSKTSFYKYGKSKEDLLYLCARQTMNLIGQVRQISKVITDDPVEAMLYNLYYARYLCSREPGPTLNIGLFRELSTEHGVVMWEIFLRWRDDLVSLIQRSIEANQVRPLEPTLVLPVMSICSGLPIRAEPAEAGFGDVVARFLYRGISTERSS
jgi:AcrR family transcriptional regulator